MKAWAVPSPLISETKAKSLLNDWQVCHKFLIWKGAFQGFWMSFWSSVVLRLFCLALENISYAWPYSLA